MKTTAEIIAEAYAVVGTWDREDIVSEAIRQGYDISPVSRVFTTIDELRQGIPCTDNKKKWPKHVNGRAKFDARQYQRDRYKKLKESGMCTICKEVKAVPGMGKCEKCRREHREYKKDHYRRNGGGYIAEIRANS